MNGMIVLGSAIVGLLVGLTGAGGGALMTPMLILLFSVKPSTAISSDLVASFVMRPVGGAVHFHQKTVNWKLVAWMSAGSVPAAFLGTYVLHLLGHTRSATANVERALGAALLLGALAMVVRLVLDRRSGGERAQALADVEVRPLATLGIGLVGGLVVGLTSVGAGSLMIVFLLFAYPGLAARRLVGTDLVQAIPLTASAALGAVTFGHVQVPLTSSIVVGAVPAVLVGSLLSSRVDDRWLRPAIFCVILASGLKYVGISPVGLAVAVGVALAVMGADLVVRRLRPSRDRKRASVDPAVQGVGQVVA